MPNQFGSGSFKPDAAFASAAGGFFELLKTLGVPAGGRAPDWSALTGPLAGHFEQWLRAAQSAGPWFSGGSAAPAAFAAPAGIFGPLPLGPAAARPHDAQRIFELLSRFSQLQAQLAVHWSTIAQSAARCFVARLGAGAPVSLGADQSLKLYETWVACAEEAYAETVHKPEFAQLQAELANTSAALLVEQRRHAESLVRAFGLPTRSEVDALYDQLKELRRTLAEQSHGEPARAPAKKTAARKPRTAPRKRARRGARR